MTALLYMLKRREILLDVGVSRSHRKRMLSKTHQTLRHKDN